MDGKQDSIAMKTISILGIVFLPGTYVATLFGTGMFTWVGTGGERTSSLKVSPSMWIYWVITMPLTFVTLVVWLLWSRRENQASRRRLMVHRTRVPGHGEGHTVTRLALALSGRR